MSKKLLSLALVVCMALSLLPATAQAAGDTLYEVDMTTSNPDIQLYYMIYRLNKYREENGLSPVKLDKELTKAAMQRAAEIAVYYDANHIRPNGQPWYTVSGIRGSKTAENIAYGYQDPFKMVTAWADSPAHNTNMLSKDFKSVGIGYFCPNPGQYFWVQDFSSDEVKDELVIDLSEATHNTTRMTYSVEALGSNLPLAFTAQAEELTVGRTIPSGYAVIGNKGLSGGNVRAVIRKVESLNPDLASAVLNNDGTVSITGRGAVQVHHREQLLLHHHDDGQAHRRVHLYEGRLRGGHLAGGLYRAGVFQVGAVLRLYVSHRLRNLLPEQHRRGHRHHRHHRVR